MADPTVFEQIIAREIPADIVYEDEQCLALRDINPQTPVHLLVVPKRVIERLGAAVETDEALLGHLLRVAGQLGREHGPLGFRVVVNHGTDGGETVPHMHLHVLAGRPLDWPPG